MADTIVKTVLAASVGPAELEAGRTYVHDVELEERHRLDLIEA